MVVKVKRGTDAGISIKPGMKKSAFRRSGLQLSCGLEVKTILWFKVVEEPGKHGEGIFRVALGGDGEAAFLLEQDSPVALFDMDAVEPTVPLFAGVLERVEVSCMEGDYPEAELRVRSGTVLLDRRKKYRVFQNPYGTCYDVFRHIAKETGCAVAFPEEDGLLGGPLFQYMETDWELLRRVAGRMGTVVAADTHNSRPGVYLGMPGGKHRQAGDVLESAAVFEGRRYYALREKGLKIARQDFICYDITTTENLELGDKVSYQGRELVVCRREIGYSGSMVVYRCRLAGKTYAMAVEECNPYLAGLTLEGSVTRRVGEACGVFFDVMYLRERAMVDRHILAEALTGEGAYLYPYAPVTGNLMYSMPERGARVTLELRSSREGSAVVSACLHRNCREPWEPGERLLCAEYGGFSRQLGIGPVSCAMSTDGVGSVSLDDGGVELWTVGKVLMYAGEKIRVEGRVQALLRTQSGILANSGSQASSMWLGGRQDWHAPYTVLHGWVYQEHECYQDAPRKGHFDWGKYLVNVTQGLQVVVGCAALTAVSGPFATVFLAATISAGMKLWSMSAADYESGNVRDTWQSQSQVTLSAVEGGLSGAVGTVLPGVGMVLVNAGISVEFGKLDRALEYHELLFTDYRKWLEVVNDPEAELWDIAWSVVPDVVVEGGSAIKRKIGGDIAEAAGKGVDMSVARGEFLDDVEISRDAGNLLETGDFTGNPGRTYSIVPESTGGVTRQLSAELPSTAGEWKGMSTVWGNADDLRLPVAAGEMPHSWDVPGVGDYVGNPGGVYGIVPGDIDHAITSQLTTDVKSAASSLDVGDIRMDGFRVPEVDTARAVAGGGEGGSYSSLRDLMSPEEVARYNEYWVNVAENISNEAIDSQIAYIKAGGITKPGGGKYQPAKISATVDLNTGDVYFGYNGVNKFNPSRTEIVHELQERIDYTMELARKTKGNVFSNKSSFEFWSVDNCAEIYSVNNALMNGASMDNIFINTKYFKDGIYAPPCKNCQITFEGVNMPNGR